MKKSIIFASFLISIVFADNNKINSKIPLDDLQRFTSVINHIDSYYVDDIDRSKLFENAINGMLSGLDPHSSYYNRADFEELQVNTSGKFVGLGVKVTMDDGFIKVISPLDDTPASKVGIKPNDLIIRLGDTPVKGLTLRQAVEMMRGEVGSIIRLTVIRDGEEKPLLLDVKRETIVTKSVKHKLLHDNYGLIRLSQFQSNSPKDFTHSIESLKKLAKPKLNGLIIDLRNNPGGVLDSCVAISEMLLDSAKLKKDKLIVYAKGRTSDSYLAEYAKGSDLTNGLPLVVLINEGSASAAEIVAGALQDHKRAIVVGKKSFGKGSVQTILPLQDNHGMKLTTALYYTPNGRSIQAEGIKPDIEIDNLKISAAKEQALDEQFILREKDFQGHLKNANPTDQTKKNDNIISTENLAQEDYQLYQALVILKSLAYKEV